MSASQSPESSINFSDQGVTECTNAGVYQTGSDCEQIIDSITDHDDYDEVLSEEESISDQSIEGESVSPSDPASSPLNPNKRDRKRTRSEEPLSSSDEFPVLKTRSGRAYVRAVEEVPEEEEKGAAENDQAIPRGFFGNLWGTIMRGFGYDS